MLGDIFFLGGALKDTRFCCSFHKKSARSEVDRSASSTLKLRNSGSARSGENSLLLKDH